MEVTYIILGLCSLLFSAFFSGLEIAFTASNTLLLSLEESENRTLCYIRDIFRGSPSRFLSSVLIGNTLSLIVFCWVVVQLSFSTIFEENLSLEILLVSLVVVIAAEFIPRLIVIRSPEFFLRAFIFPAFIFYIIFYPLCKVCQWISQWIIWLAGYNVPRGVILKNFDMDDLQTLVEEEIAQSNPLENEMRILHNALDFQQIKVRECMVPRVEIEAFDVDGSIAELSKIFISTKFSRIPIYRYSVDSIIGYVSFRQLFKKPENIEDILNGPLYVPSSYSAQELLQDFIREGKSMAIVIDEFGATAGLITTEDILEEIFGEIDDEHDADYFVGKELSDGEYLVSGRADLEEIEEKFGIQIAQSEDYETLAGYLLFSIGDMPELGYTHQDDNYIFSVERVASGRISLVKVTRK